MSVKNKNTEEKWLLPFCIIEDATTGNVMAINTVMKHYEGYIAKLATRKMYPLLIIMAFTVVLIMAIYGVAVARTATREIGKINYKPNS